MCWPGTPRAGHARVVYVSHDALYNGAQLLSLHIVKGLCEQLGFQVDVILLSGGPLAPDFARYARVHDFSVPGCTPERQAEVIREIFDSGARAAITSTTVSGALVVPLKRQGFRVVSLVHELPGLIRKRKLEGSLVNIARFADRVVFPTRGVGEKVCDLYPISLEKVIIRPQGRSTATRIRTAPTKHANSFAPSLAFRRRHGSSWGWVTATTGKAWTFSWKRRS